MKGENSRYPRGQLNAQDEGSVGLAVTVKDGTVILAFAKPVVWLGLGYDEAKSLGESLLRCAEKVRQ